MNCPLCHSIDHQPHLSPYHWRGSKQTFSVVQCSSCGTLYTQDAPDESQIGAYYEGDTYISHTDAKATLFDKVYGAVKQYMLAQKWKWIRRFVPRGTIVDYGAGSGAFVDFLTNMKRTAMGYELSDVARKNGHSMYGVDLQHPDAMTAIKEESIAACTLWHVLEHLYDPIEKLKMFHGKLLSKGLLVIAVPNPESADAKYYKEHWAAWDVPIHISHFPPKVMVSTVEKLGFNLIQKRGMPFDAFYVSMISNENKYGSKKPLLGCWKGLQSNFHGMKTGNYSSMVYIFRKKD